VWFDLGPLALNALRGAPRPDASITLYKYHINGSLSTLTKTKAHLSVVTVDNNQPAAATKLQYESVALKQNYLQALPLR
jgi:hypothetical protein